MLFDWDAELVINEVHENFGSTFVWCCNHEVVYLLHEEYLLTVDNADWFSS